MYNLKKVKTRLKLTCDVDPGQVNLDEVVVDSHLPGITHLLHQTTENLHTTFRKESQRQGINDRGTFKNHLRGLSQLTCAGRCCSPNPSWSDRTGSWRKHQEGKDAAAS